MKKYLLVVITLVAAGLLTESCSYNKTEDVYVQPALDTAGNVIAVWDTSCLGSPDTFGYASAVKPIIESSCAARSDCHGGNASYPPNLTTHAAVLEWVRPGQPKNSKIVNYITSGYMPLGGPELSDCEKAKITEWVNQGAKND